MIVTRKNQRTDTYYVHPEGGVFVTPDGVGRYYYSTLEEAQEQHGFIGDDRVVYLDADEWPDD